MTHSESVAESCQKEVSMESFGAWIEAVDMDVAMEYSQILIYLSLPILTITFLLTARLKSMNFPLAPAGTNEPRAKILFIGTL
jgi:hypothetical protein